MESQQMDNWKTFLIAAASGGAVGALISLFSPLVGWFVEWRKLLRKDRQAAINRWRMAAKNASYQYFEDKEHFPYDINLTRATCYQELRQKLSNHLVNDIERKLCTMDSDPLEVKSRVFDEIARLEQKWKLI